VLCFNIDGLQNLFIKPGVKEKYSPKLSLKAFINDGIDKKGYCGENYQSHRMSDVIEALCFLISS
jgi:hypothetical protein